jgi:hypothetical protein
MFAARIGRIAIAFGVDRGGFIHGHSVDWFFLHFILTFCKTG